MKNKFTLFISTFLYVYILILPIKILASASTESLTIHTAFPSNTIAPLLNLFTEQTDIPVNVVYNGYSEVVEIAYEAGENAEADVFILPEALQLNILNKKNMLQPLPEKLFSNIHEHYQDKTRHWIPPQCIFARISL